MGWDRGVGRWASGWVAPPGTGLYLFPTDGDVVEVVDGAVVASEQLVVVAGANAAAYEEANAAGDDDGWNRFSALRPILLGQMMNWQN